MKNTKTCPKCASGDIIKIEGTVGAYGAGNNVAVTWTKYAKVDRYLCGACGYSEEWIDRKDIDLIRKKYQG